MQITKQHSKRSETKGAIIRRLIARKRGATLQELMGAAGWQAHSVRGFISILQSRAGVEVTSSRRQDGARVYQGGAPARPPIKEQTI